MGTHSLRGSGVASLHLDGGPLSIPISAGALPAEKHRPESAVTHPIIAIVVAVAENGVIGRDGTLPWRIPTDLKKFRTMTMGKPLIMGRRTYESIGKPLDGRDNIVVTRDKQFSAQGALVAHDTDEALSLASACADARHADEIMVIGGADIFAAFLPSAQRIYWTEIVGSPLGDTVFPPLEADQWRQVSVTDLPRGEKDDFACRLKVLERAGPPRDTALGGAGPAIV